MRERGWREAGVMKPGRKDSDRFPGPRDVPGLDRLGGMSVRMNGV